MRNQVCFLVIFLPVIFSCLVIILWRTVSLPISLILPTLACLDLLILTCFFTAALADSFFLGYFFAGAFFAGAFFAGAFFAGAFFALSVASFKA
jgi:hypothetical protein